MKTFRILTFLTIAVISFNHVMSQAQPVFDGKDPNTTEADFKLKVSKTKDICVGDVIEFCFTGHVKADGWHLYSSRDDGNISYNPTALVLFDDESKGVELVGKMTENKKPNEREDEIMGGTIRDFSEHEVTFCQKVKITAATVELIGEFSAQTCVDESKGGMCKFLRLPMEWKFTAKNCEEKSGNGSNENGHGGDGENSGDTGEASPDTVKEVVVDSVPEKKNDSAGTAVDDSNGGTMISEAAGDDNDCNKNLIWLFIESFSLGLLAILTPCVYPMIPLTVSFFTKQSDGASKASGIKNGVIYALSIILIYGIGGLLVSIIFGDDALYKMSTHPVSNIIFFVIFFVFALSFLGMFELTLPSSWSTKINAKAGKGGTIGVFFMALTLVLVSFSCTGPLLGNAVVSASRGGCAGSAATGMFAFGFAFGIPFGLFAIFPKLLEKIPQAGGWMNTIKVVFGFLELALCLKFLSNVDLMLHWHILDRQVFLGIWVVVFTLLGAYFLGWIMLPHDDKVERISVPRFLMAVASFCFAIYLVPGLWGGPLDALEGLIPPNNKSIGVKLLPHQVSTHGGGSGEAMNINAEICKQDRKYAELMADRETHGFCMFYDFEQAKEFAKKHNKPLFVDFTGHSCANCRKMENGVWPDDRVRKILLNEYVMVSLYADEREKLPVSYTAESGKKIRTVGDWVIDYQSTHFNTIAQPLYVLMDHNEKPLNKERGFTPDIETYYEFLKEGVAEFNRIHGIQKEE